MAGLAMNLKELGELWSTVPDDVLFARLRALGFVVGDSGAAVDEDQVEAARDHEDWWNANPA